MPLFLAVSGYHNAGKTSLITSLFQIFKSKGYKIGVIKSSREEKIVTDIPQKDTWFYRELGIPLVGFFQKKLFTFYFSTPPLNLDTFERVYNFLESLFWDYDLVFLEGFKNFDMIYKIWVVKDEKEDLKQIKRELKNLIGFVVKENKEKWEENYPGEKFFLFDKQKELTEEIQRLLELSQQKVLLKVNNKNIHLNNFVQKVLKYQLLGFLKALKNVPEEVKDLEIRIKLDSQSL